MNTAPSLFDGHAQAYRETYAVPQPALKDGSEVAVYDFTWRDFFPEPTAMYRLTAAIHGHCIGSTVTGDTLRRCGYEPPPMTKSDLYDSRSCDDNNELLCN